MPDLAFRLALGGADSGLVERIDKALRADGITVLGSSPRGIDARASKQAIERFFLTSVRTEGNVRFEGEPDYSRLPDGPTYRAYFPRAPELF